MTYSPPIVINNIDEAMTLYINSLPWEEDIVRARTVLACLEYLIVARPQQSQLSSVGLSYERITDELKRVREYLGYGDVGTRYMFQRVSSDKIC